MDERTKSAITAAHGQVDIGLLILHELKRRNDLEEELVNLIRKLIEDKL